jgi:hypothetical protein
MSGEAVSGIKLLALAAVAAACLSVGVPRTQAQIGISIGVAPSCPYGYYDSTPYGCAPYGYYGPEWFHSGVFVGAGPWFHGSSGFQGHVNNSFDPQHGYSGQMPNSGEKAVSRNRAPKQFKGNEVRDGRGHGDGDHHDGEAKH